MASNQFTAGISLLDELHSPLNVYNIPTGTNSSSGPGFTGPNWGANNTGPNNLFNTSGAPAQDIQVILCSASHFALMAAGNEGHTTLYHNFMQMKYKYEAQNERLTELKEELKEVKQELKDIRNAVPRPPIPGQSHDDNTQAPKQHLPEFSLTVPPSPPMATENDYPHVPYWRKIEWSEHCTRLRQRNQTVDKLGFLCDENGNRLTDFRVEAIYGAAVIAWNELYFEHLDPETWSKKIAKAWEFFSATMCTKFPELGWCEGDWKLHEFATQQFPNWHRYHRQSGKLKCRVPSKRKSTEDAESSHRMTKKCRAQTSPHQKLDVIDLESDENSTTSSIRRPIPRPHPIRSNPAPGNNIPISSNPNTVVSPGISSINDVVTPTTPASTQSLTNDSIATTSTYSHGSVLPAHATAPATLASTQPEHISNSETTPLEPIDSHSPNSHPPSALEPTNEGISHSTAATTATASTQPPNSSSPPPGEEAPQLTRPSRRTRINPLANLSIPGPSSEVSQTTGPAPPAPAKSKKGKLLQVSETSLTARNLYAVEYKKQHPDATATEFKSVYNGLDKATLEQYKELSRELAKKKKAAAPPAQDTA